MKKNIRIVEIRTERANDLLKSEQERTSNIYDLLMQTRKEITPMQLRLYSIQEYFVFVKGYIDMEMEKKRKKSTLSSSTDSLSQDLQDMNQKISGLQYQVNQLKIYLNR